MVPAENPAGAVYGLIVVGALLAAESGLHESHLDAVLSAVIVAGAYWLLHAYATLLGRRLTDGGRLNARALLGALAHDWTLLWGAALPIGALLLAWLFGAGQETAVSLALWIVVGSLVVFELLAGLRTHSTARELVFEAAVGVTMGLAVLSLRALLH